MTDPNRPIRIAIVCETYAADMGYAGTCIPAALARKADVEVHYVTAGLPVYYQMADFDETYGKFQTDSFGPGDTREVAGYTVHYIDRKKAPGGVRMPGLREKLAALRPDVVQTFSHAGWTPLDAARFQRALGYRLFTGNHTTASVYPLAQRTIDRWDLLRMTEFVKRGLPGRFISSRSTLCYGATVDCSAVARRFLGVPEAKLKTLPLGVDTDIFHPAVNDDERAKARTLRHDLGVGDDEIMVVYTGRFAPDKNPLLLARAVAELRAQGERYRAVFFGEGMQRDAIAGTEGTVVRAFVPYTSLGTLYRAADIGAWPTQESTSMIDCAASGTPTIVNGTIAAVERVEGNGLMYRLGDIADLKRALLDLKVPDRRRQLGEFGAHKMETSYSWNALVQVRLDDYRAALAR